MYDMLIRKKTLKIQERLGMRIGIANGTTKIESPKTVNDVINVLTELYKIGAKAYTLPKNFFSKIKSTTDLYKVEYGNLLKIKDIAQKYNIELSLHDSALPDDPVGLDNTLMNLGNIASIMDARIFTIHPTFYKNMPQEQSVRLAVYKINEFIPNLKSKIPVGIETTGKINEVGSVEDVIDIVKRTQGTEPVINWAHVHARGSGFLRSPDDYKKILDKVRMSVGNQWLNNAFFFFSGVSYGPSGEIRHIPLEKSDINLEHLIREIMAMNIKGTLIFEDPNREKFVLNILDKMADMVR